MPDQPLATSGSSKEKRSGLSALLPKPAASRPLTPRTKADAALVVLRNDFCLDEGDMVLGQSVCTSQRGQPGVLHVTNYYVCFQPTTSATGSSETNPTLQAGASTFSSAGVGIHGRQRVGVTELTVAERTKRWRKNAGNAKG